MARVTTTVTIKGQQQLDKIASQYISFAQQAREGVGAIETSRNVNKSRAGLNIRVIRGVKRFGDRLGRTASGLLGERGIKLRGIVGATAGLLAFDKMAETFKRYIQGQELKDAIGFQLKELVPPLMRETLPAILDETDRRRRLIEESKRQALQHDRDLEKRLLKEPSFRRAAAEALGGGVVRDPNDQGRLNLGVDVSY